MDRTEKFYGVAGAKKSFRVKRENIVINIVKINIMFLRKISLGENELPKELFIGQKNKTLGSILDL